MKTPSPRPFPEGEGGERSKMLRLYYFLTLLLHPLMPLYLSKRLKRGKEDPARWREKMGEIQLPRPAGKLLWIHAASVGESQSVLPLVAALRENYAQWHILLTTGTVTSARLMAERLPKGVIHQFAPIDTPQAVKRFLHHWQPDTAFWVESELWPNMLAYAKIQGVKLALINARMSEKSMKGWKRFPKMISKMLRCFETIYAQSEADGERLKLLSPSWGDKIRYLGNLKYDSPPLPVDKAKVTEIREFIGNRPCWLAASIHPGEDAIIAEAHRKLRDVIPNILTIVVPRHPEKGAAMQQLFWSQDCEAALRSRNELLETYNDGTGTQIYIADTMGELGVFYSLAPITFMGGSLIPHGGQNPLEAARFACPLLFGPHMFNFQDIRNQLLATGGAEEIQDAAMLAEHVQALLQDDSGRKAMGAKAKAYTDAQTGAATRLLQALAPLLE